MRLLSLRAAFQNVFHLDFRASFCDLSAVLTFISDSVIIFIVLLFPWFSLVEKNSEMKNKLQKALKTKCL